MSNPAAPKHLTICNTMDKSPVRVLVVDDEEDLELLVRQKLRRRIRKGELEFLFAHNGREALEQLAKNPDVRLVLSDINMPIMDGLTLLNQLAEVDQDVQAVIVSAYGDMDNIRIAMNRGAFDFLTKPIDFNDLEITIEKAIRHIHEMQTALEARDNLVAIRQELDVARQVQMSVRPKALPENRICEVKAEIIPAREIGGDLYDYFYIDEFHLGLVIADVSGKGVPAALFTLLTRALLRAASKDHSSPAECLDLVNDLLSEDNETCIFVTLFFAALDVRNGNLIYSNAGHNLPRVLRVGSSVEELPSTNNLVLGVLKSHQYSNDQIQLAPGDTLILYTDGITEAENNLEEEFGEARLDEKLAGLAGMSAGKVLQDVIDTVREFAGNAPQSDDITCLVARMHDLIESP